MFIFEIITAAQYHKHGSKSIASQPWYLLIIQMDTNGWAKASLTDKCVKECSYATVRSNLWTCFPQLQDQFWGILRLVIIFLFFFFSWFFSCLQVMSSWIMHTSIYAATCSRHFIFIPIARKRHLLLQTLKTTFIYLYLSTLFWLGWATFSTIRTRTTSIATATQHRRTIIIIIIVMLGQKQVKWLALKCQEPRIDRWFSKERRKNDDQ